MIHFHRAFVFLRCIAVLFLAFPALSSDKVFSDESSDSCSQENALNLRGKNLTDKELTLLGEKGYEEIDLAYTDIKRHGLASLQASQKTLQDLNIERDGLDAKDIKPLISFKNLEILNIANNCFNDSDLENIASSLAKLRDLNIQYNFATSRGIEYLTKLRNLESLDCGFMDLKNEAITHISQFPNLKYLFMRSTNINHESLEHFLLMPKLEWLDLSYNRISGKALSHLMSTMKGKKIIADHLLPSQSSPNISSLEITDGKLVQAFQSLSLLKQKKTTPFQDITIDNLKKLVSLLNERGLSEKKLSALCGYSSRTPIRKLLGRLEGNIEQETFLNIKEKLGGNFDDICKHYNLDKEQIINLFKAHT